MSQLDRITNVIVIIASVAIAGDVSYRYSQVLQKRSPRGNPEHFSREYRPGEVFQPITGYAADSRKAALLFVVESTCRYCEASIPFYQQLVEEVRRSAAAVRLVGICLESSQACSKFFTSNGIALDATVGAERGSLRVAGTPTLLLVDGTGRVSSVWRGKLAAKGEAAVLRAVLQQNSKE